MSEFILKTFKCHLQIAYLYWTFWCMHSTHTNTEFVSNLKWENEMSIFFVFTFWWKEIIHDEIPINNDKVPYTASRIWINVTVAVVVVVWIQIPNEMMKWRLMCLVFGIFFKSTSKLLLMKFQNKKRCLWFECVCVLFAFICADVKFEWYTRLRKITASSFTLLVGRNFRCLLSSNKYRPTKKLNPPKITTPTSKICRKKPNDADISINISRCRRSRDVLCKNKNELTKKKSLYTVRLFPLYTYCHSLCQRNNWFDPFYSQQF